MGIIELFDIYPNFIEKYKNNKNFAITYLNNCLLQQNVDIDKFIENLTKEKLNKQEIEHITEVLITHDPYIIKMIDNPTRALCIKAILKNPYTIKIIPQDTFLTKLAMSKEIATYTLINNKFKTYEYYMKYKNEEVTLKQILIKIKEYDKIPEDILFILKMNLVVGIEIEFSTNKDIFELYLLLKKFVNIKISSSGINKGNQWLLSKENSKFNTYEISSKKLSLNNKTDILELYKVCTALEVLEKFSRIKRIPEYCGLHIHVEKKNYDSIIKDINNYLYLQPVLYKLVAIERRYNPFCIPLTQMIKNNMENYKKINSMTYTELKKNKYYSINPYAYFYNHTLEFRQHESIFNFTSIVHWIHILQSIMTLKKLNRQVLFLDSFYKIANINKKVRTYYTNKYINK